MVQPVSYRERAPRLPMFVQVTADPPLPDCWSVNVSRSGIGLVCGGGVEARVSEGDEVRLAFRLPDSDRPVRARGTVTWLYGRQARSGEGIETAIGIVFTAIEAADRVGFERHLLEHRFQVAVALASTDERRAVEAELGGAFNLHFVDDEATLHELLTRGDISALVVCGDDGRRATRLVNHSLDALLEGKGAVVLPPDLMPAIVYCAAGSSEELIALFNAGRVLRSLPRPIDTGTLRRALQTACSMRGQRTEQRRVAQALERALVRQRAADRPAATLSAAVEARVVADSGSMQETLGLARRVAPHTLSVLLTGETGVGKEVVAGLIHELSPRAASAMVIQDCGLLTPTLLESELFGHVKGAFTGAVANHPGLFVMADGGTVFLDEIENTTADLQAKLLRVIETGMIRPVGGTRTRHVDVRVIAASNRDLGADVRAGAFRADLYYRLSSFPIRVAPLRERRDDIPPLCTHFLAAANERLGSHVRGLTPRAQRALQAYAWPGNIRELRNCLERAVLLCDGHGDIDLPHLGEPFTSAAPSALGGSLRQQVQRHERQLIASALADSGGVLRAAARALDTSPVTLRRKAMAYRLL